MPNARKSMARKSQLKKGFEAAKTPEEMVKKFKAMEPYFEEKDLARELLQLSNRCDGDPEKVIFYGKRILKILIEDENSNEPRFGLDDAGCFVDNGTSGSSSSSSSSGKTHPSSSYFISWVLISLTKASLELERFNEGLSYANWADRNFTMLRDKKSSVSGDLVLRSLAATQGLLAFVKGVMGRRDEEVVHLRNVLEIREGLVEEGSVELGRANMNVYEAYVLVGKFKEALPFCLKAFGIYERHFGRESGEVACVVKDLGVIYKALGESEKECVLKSGSSGNEEAVGMLNQMKKSVAEVSPQSKDGEDISERISKCGISDDN